MAAFGPGEQVGDYQILQVLGAGGMGKVYLIRNVITDRVEALKVLLPDLSSDAEPADRFLREIRMLASLSHSNIASLHTALKVNNQLLMVMEYVEGETVQKLISKGPLPVGKALDYADQALGALGYAHSRNIIHRDIKPANVMVTRAGVAKLMDFGIARAMSESRLTQTGRTVGSSDYMSPEQINGQVLDCRADIYAFGISLYEMVTGTLPFKGTNDFSIMYAHLNQLPVPPIEIDSKMPSMLNDIILKAIDKDRNKRFQTAEKMRDALQMVTHGITRVMEPLTPNSASMPSLNLPEYPPTQSPISLPHGNQLLLIALSISSAISLSINLAILIVVIVTLVLSQRQAKASRMSALSSQSEAPPKKAQVNPAEEAVSAPSQPANGMNEVAVSQQSPKEVDHHPQPSRPPSTKRRSGPKKIFVPPTPPLPTLAKQQPAVPLAEAPPLLDVLVGQSMQSSTSFSSGSFPVPPYTSLPSSTTHNRKNISSRKSKRLP